MKEGPVTSPEWQQAVLLFFCGSLSLTDCVTALLYHPQLWTQSGWPQTRLSPTISPKGSAAQHYDVWSPCLQDAMLVSEAKLSLNDDNG
jgi:hypothetical protein